MPKRANNTRRENSNVVFILTSDSTSKTKTENKNKSEKKGKEKKSYIKSEEKKYHLNLTPLKVNVIKYKNYI